MKKYKTLTNDLDWFGIKKGHVYVENDFGIWFRDDIKCNVYNQSILTTARSNPKWFLEIPTNEFTRNDIKEFLENTFADVLSDRVMKMFDDWVQQKKNEV